MVNDRQVCSIQCLPLLLRIKLTGLPGVTVSAKGRIFSNYPAGLDPNNVNDGKNHKFQVAEVTDRNNEKPYPNVKLNSPPGGAINYTTSPPTAANYDNHLIGVQSVVIDSKDRLWILDTGRAVDSKTSAQVPSREGGPKLIGINLENDSVIKTITFPPTVAYPDSYLNDVRFDLRDGLSGINGTEGVAYITDSSSEGRNGVIIVDIGTGKTCTL